MDLKEEQILGEYASHHWYYVSKGRAIRAFLEGVKPRSILDVGAGSGIFSRIILQSTQATKSICVDPGYSEEYKYETWDNKTIEFVRSIESSDANLALFIDVLEHVDDDLALLKNFTNKLPAGSNVFISVPAFPFLFSGHDLFLEHKRRYTLKGLEAIVERSGLKIIKSGYCFASIFPFVAAQRLLSKLFINSGKTTPKSSLRRHSEIVNSAS